MQIHQTINAKSATPAVPHAQVLTLTNVKHARQGESYKMDNALITVIFTTTWTRGIAFVMIVMALVLIARDLPP